jgi:hypothetical protein
MVMLYMYRLVCDGALRPEDGATAVAEEDFIRLARQQRAVFDVMKDGRLRTLHEISRLTGAPEASVSARLRDFRKQRYGGSTVERHPAYVPE